jgi:hypothetical protein
MGVGKRIFLEIRSSKIGMINAVIPNFSKRVSERYAPIIPPRLLILVEKLECPTDPEGSTLEYESRQQRVKMAKPIRIMPAISLHRYGRFFAEDFDEFCRTAMVKLYASLPKKLRACYLFTCTAGRRNKAKSNSTLI